MCVCILFVMNNRIPAMGMQLFRLRFFGGLADEEVSLNFNEVCLLSLDYY